MTTYIHRPDHPNASKYGMVDKSLLCEDELFGESAYVISDTMEPTRHMVTNRMHTSKSEFRKDTRRAGCVEVGNETGHLLSPRTPVKLSKKDRVEHIKHAIKVLQEQ
jgi:hypothetical protein